MAKKKSASKKKSDSAPASAKKKGGAKKAGDKKKSKAKSMEPVPVKTGKGASVAEVAGKFMELFTAAGMNPPEEQIWKALYHKQCRSIEGAMGMAWDGLKAMKGKADWWYSQNTLNSVKTEGPFVGATGFGVKYTVDVTCKESGERTMMSEIGLYTVKNGKIVQEEFMALGN